MINLSPWDIPCVSWGDVLASTGIDDRRLRNAIDRGVLPFGKKQSNRLLFSLRERLAIDLMSALTSQWVPVSIAATVAQRVSPKLEIVQAFWNEAYLPAENDKKPDLRLTVANVEGDLIALGVTPLLTSWSFDDPELPIIVDKLPISFTCSLIYLHKRHLSYCIANAGDEPEE